MAWLVFQAGTTPGGRVLDRLEQAVKAPLPGVSTPPSTAPQVSRPDQWVPDRYVVRPDGVMLHVPGHWERPISSTEVYAPPLVACPTVGECVLVPAGPRPPVEVRQGP